MVEAQGFNNLFMGISKNQKIGESYREAFIKAQMDNGGSIDTDTAKDFRTLAVNMAAAGKTQAKILETWNTRQQAFAVAGTSREDNKELNKQMGQMAGDSMGSASDANVINDRMPMLTPYVVREFMKDHGIEDYTKGLASYNKDLKGGKGVKSVWYEEAMRNLVAENQPSLERNRNSVASQQQRADNQAYLNTNSINSEKALADVLSERLVAERDLNNALVPLQKTLATFDLGLIKLSTAMLRLSAGRDADGNEKSEQQQLQERMSTNDLPVDTKMVGGHDYSGVDAETQHQGGWIGNFYNRLFGVQDHRKGEASNLKVQEAPDPFAMQFMKLDLSKLGVDLDNDGQYRQFRPPVFNAEDAMKRATQFQPSYPAESQGQQKEVPAPNITNNNTTTVNPANVSITINAESADAEEVGRIVDERVRDAWSKSWREADAASGSEVY